MKKPLHLSLVLLLCSLTAFAQTHRYHFEHGLNEIFGQGPILTPMCPGNIASASLPIGVTKNVYNFPKGCGLIYDDGIKNFLATAPGYTVELYFKLDTITGYKKLMDVDSLGADKGLYNQNGKVVLYPSFTSSDSFFAAGTFQYVAVTRNHSNKEMYINCNGKTAGTYIDNSDAYLYDSNQLVIFFMDDNNTNGEEASGAVAMIHISNSAMDSNTIKTRYTQLNATLGIESAANRADDILIYPNPSSDVIHIRSHTEMHYSISDLTGKPVAGNRLQTGNNTINISNLPHGLYFLRLVDANGETWVEKITKQ